MFSDIIHILLIADDAVEAARLSGEDDPLVSGWIEACLMTAICPSDDKEGFANLQPDGLQFPKFELTRVSCLSDGLAYLDSAGNSNPIDVVLVSLMLSDSQGLETFRRLHAHSPQLPVVVLTDSHDESLGVDAVRAGAQDYIVYDALQRSLFDYGLNHAMMGRWLARTLRAAVERQRVRRASHNLGSSRDPGAWQPERQKHMAFKASAGAQFEMQRQNEFLKNVIESLTHPFFVVNVDDYTVAIANAAARRLGVSVSAFDAGHLSVCHSERSEESSRCYEISHRRHTPCEGAAHPCPLQEVKRTGKPVVFEHVHYDADGKVQHVEIHGYPVFNAQGDVVQMIEYTLDITDRVRVNNALHESEDRFRRLVEESADGVMIVDADGILRFANPAAAKLLGHAEDELVGSVFGFPTVAGDTTEIDIVRRHHPREHSAPHKKRTASKRAFVARVAEMRVAETKWQGRRAYLATLRDITNRVRIEEAMACQALALARSNAELERFAYVASHHLQEPLRAVTSYTQLLLRRYGDQFDDEADKFAAFIVDGATYMSELLRDLMLYYQIDGDPRESSEQQIVDDTLSADALTAVDCEKVLELTLRRLDELIKAHRGVVKHGHLPIVKGDAKQLGQVFENLVGNAIKFHGNEAPQVYIAVEKREPKMLYARMGQRRDLSSMWVFSVRDNGIGIDPAYAERIFRIFERLNTRDKYPGTGIGLAICKKIIERHSGRIWVESEPGKGSTFYFTLPA